MIKKSARIILICIALFSILTVLTARPSYACASCAAATGAASASATSALIGKINTTVNLTFMEIQQFMTQVLWKQFILPAMEGMADELSALSIHQAFVVGTFFDAKHQLETEQILQTIKAKAHKDYHPSTGMCQFGSVAKSLSASENKGAFATLALSQRAQDRHLGTYGTVGAAGQLSDKTARIEQFKRTYCNPADNNGGLNLMCRHGGKVGATDPARMNKDINYASTVDTPWTLNIDFTDTTTTPDEEDIFALASNLFGHDVVRAATNALDNTDKAMSEKQEHYMDFRALLAKRSVAENSFNAVVGMKASGLPGSKDYLRSVLTELGVQPDETLHLLGDNPSYHAQMEVLTKKLYQNPTFYTNLYDKPANIARKEVALQAIGLMQKFDLFKSHLRNEASLAVLLELAVQKLQDSAESDITINKGGTGTIK